MKHTNRRRRYASPVMKLLTYEQALAKVRSEERRASAAQKLPTIALEVLLSVLPALVLLSVIDPSGLLRRASRARFFYSFESATSTESSPNRHLPQDDLGNSPWLATGHPP